MTTPRKIKHKRPPRYWWDKKRVCYVDYETGEPVAPKKQRAWLLALVFLWRSKLKALGAQLQSGAIDVPTWYLLTSRAIKNLHTAAAVMAVGGAKNLTGEALDTLEAREAYQFEKLIEFRNEIPSDPSLRTTAIGARAAMYAMAGVATFTNLQRLGVLARLGELTSDGGMLDTDVAVIERRVLNSHVPCDDCEMYAAMEWQPYGTLPELGDSICMSNCQCEFEYRVEGKMRDEDFDPAEVPLVLQLPKVGDYVIDPSAMPLGAPARLDSPRVRR